MKINNVYGAIIVLFTVMICISIPFGAVWAQEHDAKGKLIKAGKADTAVFNRVMATKKTYWDAFGKNTLSVKVINPCNADSSIFDGTVTKMEVRLKNKKSTTTLTYNYPYPQMALIQFLKDEIHIQDFGGRKAAIIPFYYCGGYESYDMKVSYIVIFANKKYIYHLDYYCGEGQNCKPVQSLASNLANLPKEIRIYMVAYLTNKHKSKKSFHQD